MGQRTSKPLRGASPKSTSSGRESGIFSHSQFSVSPIRSKPRPHSMFQPTSLLDLDACSMSQAQGFPGPWFSASSISSFDDCGFFRRQVPYRHSTRSVLQRPVPSQPELGSNPDICSVSGPSETPRVPSVPIHPMRFEVPSIDSDVPLIGRDWIYHELYEILIRPGIGDTANIRGAVIHGHVGTGKTAALYQLAHLAPSHGSSTQSGPSPGRRPRAPGSSGSGPTDSSADSGFVNHETGNQPPSQASSSTRLSYPSGPAGRVKDHRVSIASLGNGSHPPSIHPSAHNFPHLPTAASVPSANPDAFPTYLPNSHPKTPPASRYATQLASHVIAYHFCQLDVVATCHLPEFLLSLSGMLATARQLAGAYADHLASRPELVELVSDKANALRDPVDVFRRVIVEPLRYLRKTNRIPSLVVNSGNNFGPLYNNSSSNSNFVILVDGLDEAEYHRPEASAGGGHSIGSFLLTHAIRELPPWVRLIVATRSAGLEMVRSLAAGSSGQSSVGLHQVSLDNIVIDERLYRGVEDYIVYRIEQSPAIRANICRSSGPTYPNQNYANYGQTSDEAANNSSAIGRFVAHVAGLSKGCFLYLKLLLSLIERNHLVIKSSSSAFKLLPISLSECFLLLFNLKFPSAAAFERVASILNCCLASLYPLSAQALFEAVNAGFVDNFLTWEEFCERLLSLFDFLVQRDDDTFVLFHPAFRDWLIRREDGESPKFLCDGRFGHSLLAFRLSRLPGRLDPERAMELGHHILKAHIYKQLAPQMPQGIRQPPVSSRDAQAAWLALSTASIQDALATDRNVFCPNTKVSRLLLLAGADPNVRTRFMGRAPLLCVSARSGCVEMLSLLVEFGADVAATGSDGISALMYSSNAGHLDIVQLLHQHGAKLTQVDNANCCALVHAASSGHVGICSFLLQCDWSSASASSSNVSSPAASTAPGPSNFEPDMTSSNVSRIGAAVRQQAAQQAFVAAAGNGHTQVCQFLLEFADVDINVPDPITRACGLSAAAAGAHKVTVQFLLQHGGRVSHDDAADNPSPLVQSVAGGCWEIVSELLGKGANVNTERNRDGQTPLMMAALSGHIGVLELLLGRDADVEATDSKGRSAVSWAAIKDQVPCATLLLDRGAQVDQLDQELKTPLHHAALSAGRHLVQLLLDRGASLEACDVAGHRPLDIAIQAANLDALAVFLRKGAKLGPTTWALAVNQPQVIAALLRKLAEDGCVLYKRNRTKEAIQRFQYAMKKFPEPIPESHKELFSQLKHDILLHLARVKRKIGDFNSAVELINDSLKLEPSSFEAYYLRSRCHKDLNNLIASHADTVECLRLSPSHKDARLQLVRLQAELHSGPNLASSADDLLKEGMLILDSKFTPQIAPKVPSGTRAPPLPPTKVRTRPSDATSVLSGASSSRGSWMRQSCSSRLMTSYHGGHGSGLPHSRANMSRGNSTSSVLSGGSSAGSSAGGFVADGVVFRHRQRSPIAEEPSPYFRNVGTNNSNKTRSHFEFPPSGAILSADKVTTKDSVISDGPPQTRNNSSAAHSYVTTTESSGFSEDQQIDADDTLQDFRTDNDSIKTAGGPNTKTCDLKTDSTNTFNLSSSKLNCGRTRQDGHFASTEDLSQAPISDSKLFAHRPGKVVESEC